MIQIYGCYSGYWSHAQVSRGLAYGLYTNGLKDIQICNATVGWIGSSGGYEGMSEPFEKGGYNTALPNGPGDAPIGIFVGGYPPQAGQWIDGHRYKVALFIAESATVPRAWATIANGFDLVLVPSQWVYEAYADAGVSRSKLMVVPHGIHPLYMYAQAQPAASPARFLHICGSASFAWRKGTPQLIEAFKEVFDPYEATLIIRLMYGGHTVEEAARGVPNVKLEMARTALPPDQMIALQCGGGFSALIQPSRGEAFGITPVEARAVGLPVITTHCAGHTEHGSNRDIVVPHGHDGPIRVNGITNGTAPIVDKEDIVSALQQWREDPPPVGLASEGYARRWQWPEVTRALAGALRNVIINELVGPRRLDTI